MSMQSQRFYSFLSLLIVLVGCASAPGLATDPAPGPSGVPAAEASSTGGITRGVIPSIRPGVLPTAQPSATPRPSSGQGVSVRGSVQNDGGNLLYGAGVSIQSLDPKRPYSDRVVAEKGTYKFEGVPVGLQIKVAANVRFYDPRSIPLTVSADPEANVVDFAGPYALPKR